MKIETSVWDSKFKLRESLFNKAKILLVLTCINGFYMISQKSWLMLAINVMNMIPAVILIFSKLKFDKLPPKDD